MLRQGRDRVGNQEFLCAPAKAPPTSGSHIGSVNELSSAVAPGAQRFDQVCAAVNPTGSFVDWLLLVSCICRQFFFTQVIGARATRFHLCRFHLLFVARTLSGCNLISMWGRCLRAA